MSQARYVLYHANCPDGFGAAYAAWKKYGEGTHYVPVSHGAPPPEMKNNSEVYIVDFAYDRETLLKMNAEHTVKVLDHHRSAEAQLKGLDFVEFDMNRSGAVMSWAFFHPQTEVPELLRYVQDQDLWNWELPDSQEICTALNIYPFDFEVWDNLQIDDLRKEGQVVLRFKEQLMQRVMRKIDWFEIAGHKVPAINTPLFASELGNQLCLDFPGADFAVCYADHEEMRKFSLRSVGDFDVSAVAGIFGGGGHRNASGMAIRVTGHEKVRRLSPEEAESLSETLSKSRAESSS